MDVVFWDETHQHRVDETWYERRSFNAGFGRGADRPYHKDCVYCNQTGCTGATYDGHENLPGFMHDNGRFTDITRITRLRLYNVDRSAGTHHPVHGRERVQLAEIKHRMSCAISEGRKQRDGILNSKIDITFRTAQQFLVDLAYTIGYRERGY